MRLSLVAGPSLFVENRESKIRFTNINRKHGSGHTRRDSAETLYARTSGSTIRETRRHPQSMPYGGQPSSAIFGSTGDWPRKVANNRSYFATCSRYCFAICVSRVDSAALGITFPDTAYGNIHNRTGE